MSISEDVGALGKRSRKGFRARRTGRLHSRAGGMKENDAAQRQARQRTPPARGQGQCAGDIADMARCTRVRRCRHAQQA